MPNLSLRFLSMGVINFITCRLIVSDRTTWFGSLSNMPVWPVLVRMRYCTSSNILNGFQLYEAKETISRRCIVTGFKKSDVTSWELRILCCRRNAFQHGSFVLSGGSLLIIKNGIPHERTIFPKFEEKKGMQNKLHLMILVLPLWIDKKSNWENQISQKNRRLYAKIMSPFCLLQSLVACDPMLSEKQDKIDGHVWYFIAIIDNRKREPGDIEASLQKTVFPKLGGNCQFRNSDIYAGGPWPDGHPTGT